MSYGEFNNLDLCINYGFTIPCNVLDEILKARSQPGWPIENKPQPTDPPVGSSSRRTKTSIWRSWKFPTALGVEPLLASYSDVKSLGWKNRQKLWFCFGDEGLLKKESFFLKHHREKELKMVVINS